MTWMWVIAPTIVLLGALWLVIGMRRLVGSRLALDDEMATVESVEERADGLRDTSTRVRSAADDLSRRREPDAGHSGTDR